MLTGLSENLRQINDSRETAVINDELKRLNVDIATLQETRLADSGSLKENDYTFYWQGKSSNEPREHGVGFAVRNTLMSMIEPGSVSSERLLTLRLNTNAGPVTLVSVYAPTLTSTPDAKDEFFESLATTISSIPSKEQLILLGRLQCQSVRRSRLVALVPWAVRSGQDESKWPATTRAVHFPQPVHRKLFLQDQAPAQGLLETPTLKALAPARPHPGQTLRH